MKKIILISLLLTVFVSGQAFSQSFSIENIQSAANDFSKDISYSVPFYSTLGLNWSDAYIGNLPHFGAGFSLGFTTFGSKSFDKILNVIGGDDVMPGFLENFGMPMPAYTVEGRIGGFILPFDIGVKAGILSLDISDVSIDYLLVGGDIRYALIDSAISPIKLSIGLGYNYVKGGIMAPVGENLSFTAAGRNISMDDPKLGFTWGTSCFELKTQLSLKLPIITPYAGAGLSVALSQAGYEFKTKMNVDGIDVADLPDDVKNYLGNYGISGISARGFESINDETTYNMRLFGGISFNLLILRLDLNVMYNLTGNQFGASLGARIQL